MNDAALIAMAKQIAAQQAEIDRLQAKLCKVKKSTDDQNQRVRNWILHHTVLMRCSISIRPREPFWLRSGLAIWRLIPIHYLAKTRILCMYSAKRMENGSRITEKPLKLFNFMPLRKCWMRSIARLDLNR